VFEWFVAPPCLRQSVVVNLISEPDTAIRGVLWSVRGSWFVLKNAAVLKPQLEPLAIDGDVIIHRTNVAFVQVL
jgi:hypothetical protein